MKKHRFYSFNRILITASVLLFGISLAQAQSFLGTSGDQLWSNPDNWLDGLKPNEESEQVLINADVIVDEDVVVRNLYDAVPCTLTIQSGKKLTVTSTIVWDKGGDFILDDNAQLVNDYPVQVTVKKSITAHEYSDHFWDVIASPVSNDIIPSTENGFLTDSLTRFVLYSYDEATHQFINYKDSPFPIVNGKGYLYANTFDTTLLFSGLTHGSATPFEVSLDYTANGTFVGGNLVGNPLPCNAYTDRSYYVMYETGEMLIPISASSSTAVMPCMGIFAKADAANETIHFSRTSNAQLTHNQGYIEISATYSNSQNILLDKAIVSYNPEDNLSKFIYNGRFPRLFFTENDQDLAIISIDSLDVLPLRFKPVVDSTYTLRFETKELDIEYLHLIDNMTGANINLLTSPNYTFDATSNDYASRFKLVFNPNYDVEEYENEEFAYYLNGVIYLYGVETFRETSLQMVDMSGRIVLNEPITGRDGECTVSARLVPGVYVLRLVQGNKIRVQKMAVK